MSSESSPAAAITNGDAKAQQSKVAAPAAAAQEPKQQAAASPAAPRSLDFQKLFQGPTPPDGAASPTTTPSAPSTPQGQQPHIARHPSSNLRPPAGAGSSPHGARPFEPQRSPSARMQGPPHQQFHGQQQPRSPHMGNAGNMQPMQPGPWQHQQQMPYPPPQFGYHAYGYQPVPQQWNQQQQQGAFDMSGAPRSPRHANMGANGALGMAPTTPRGAVPPSPSAAQASPAHRPQSFSPAANFAHHSPSPHFASMSPAARQFEPQQKRTSSAIRIINPQTQAAVDLQSIQRTPATPKAVAAPATKPATPTPAPASVASPAAAKASPVPQAAERKPVRIETPDDFMKRVHAAKEKGAKDKALKESSKQDAEDAQRKQQEEQAAKEQQEKEAAEAQKLKEAEEKKKAEEEAQQKAAAEEKAAADKAAAEAKAKEEADKKEAEEKAEAVKKEQEAKEAQEKQAKADQEAKEKSDADAAAAAKSKPAPIDTEKAAGHADEAASSQDLSVPKTAGLPMTPRTPGTPGFAGLPAKPLSSIPASNGIKLDGDALEKKKKNVTLPEETETSADAEAPSEPQTPEQKEDGIPAAAASLTTAKFIDNFSKINYPENISSPKPELNESAEPGKFRYDRDFLMQFMSVFTEKPVDLPSLASIGMETGMRQGRRAAGMGPPSMPGRSGLGISGPSGYGGKGGAFGQVGKTSEERFAAAAAGGGRASAMGGAFGPMGSFNAGARSQPLSRTGSGSAALPSREMMGTGVPQGARTKSNRGRQRDPNSSRGGSQFNAPDKGGPTIPMDQVAPLDNSENRWSRGVQVKADSPEMVQRKVKSLLNKLTIEKFDSISNQILEWANKSVTEDDGRTLRQVIQLIFEKATDEAAWSEMYARLCRKLMEEVSNDVKDENLRTADDKPVVGGLLFRKYLLNRCQEDFERGWAQRDTAVAAAKAKEDEDRAKLTTNEKAEADAKSAEERGEKPAADDKEPELLSDEYYEAQKAKRRGLGLVRFIGELFKLQMLMERIMHLCIKKLLSNATDPEEEEIESLCKLLTTVGKLLDSEKARGHMDVYFSRMKTMSQNETSINSRMRFMLKDVIELRESHWVPRHDNSAPKTIAQIHADAARQKHQQDQENAMRTRGGGGGTISRGGSKRGQMRGDGPDGWSTVGPTPAPRPSKAGDLSSFGKIERGASARPLSFGPATMLGRKGAAGGGKTSEDGSQPPTRTNSQSNMFSLLNQSGEAEAAPGAGGAAAAGGERPRLNLAPRTKPLPTDDDDNKEEEDEEDKEGSVKETDDELTDEEAKRKIANDIKEFLEIKDVNEGLEAFVTLPKSRQSQFIESIVGTAVEKKKDDVANVALLFTKLTDSEELDEETAVKGLEPHMEFLDDAAIDIPAMYSFMADLMLSLKLSQEKIEELADKIVGEGIKTPKARLLEKVAAARA